MDSYEDNDPAVLGPQPDGLSFPNYFLAPFTAPLNLGV